MFFSIRPSSRLARAAGLVVVLAFTSIAAGAAPAPITFKGEKFVVHTIEDRQQGGLTWMAFLAPEKWQVTGEVRWKYEDVSVPVTAFVRATNPDKAEVLTMFPRVSCYWLTGAAAFNRPGTTALGQINLQPMSPPEALRSAVMKLYHPNQPDLQIVGVRDLPNLAATMGQTSKDLHGLGLKVSYSENGQAFDEEFYALYYNAGIPYDGPQGHSVQINWGLYGVHSFKAPRGTLDQRREVFAYMAHSVKVNPEWQARDAAIEKMLNEQFNRNLAQGYANIEAAGRLSRQISANNDAMIASMDRQRAASNAAAPTANGRSSNDKFDDYVRGVDTMNDPLTGTSQHSSNEQFHWTDGYGNYTHSNDASFNPNASSSVSWQQMTPAR